VRQAAFHQVSAELPHSIFWWNHYSAWNSVEQSPRLLNILNQPWSWPPWTRLFQIGCQHYRRSLQEVAESTQYEHSRTIPESGAFPRK
jgi:hypothetical protein